jgi:hypothetical protein
MKRINHKPRYTCQYTLALGAGPPGAGLKLRRPNPVDGAGGGDACPKPPNKDALPCADRSKMLMASRAVASPPPPAAAARDGGSKRADALARGGVLAPNKGSGVRVPVGRPAPPNASSLLGVRERNDASASAVNSSAVDAVPEPPVAEAAAEVSSAGWPNIGKPETEEERPLVVSSVQSGTGRRGSSGLCA